MWKLIKADSYNQFINYIQWPIILGLVTVNSIRGGMENSLAITMFFLAIFIGGIVSAESVKTKRIRLLSGLPIPARTLGMYRHYGTVVGWIIWMALLFLSSLISRRGNISLDYLWWLLTKIGSIYAFAGCMSLATDLYFCAKNRRLEMALMKWIVSTVLFFAGTIAVYLYFLTNSIPAPKYGWIFKVSEMLSTFYGAFGILLIGIVLLALDVCAYQRRRTYLEDSVWPS